MHKVGNSNYIHFLPCEAHFFGENSEEKMVLSDMGKKPLVSRFLHLKIGDHTHRIHSGIK